MGEFIYERLGKNRGQLEQRKLDEYTRSSWHDLRVSDIHPGPVWQSITITGKLDGCTDPSGIHCEIRLYNLEKKVEFCYSMKKLAVTDPEGVYIAFPLKLNNSHHVVEVAGGTMVPGKEQIEGSASDWVGIQNFVALRNDSNQVVFSSPEIPLVQLGEINLGKFSRMAHPVSGSIFSWVLNNYWTTNFLASQEGELKWTYQISSMADASNATATKFGMESRIPMLNRVFPASSRPDSVLIPRSFFTSRPNNLILISSRPACGGKGIVMQLRETTGKPDSLPVHDLLLSSTQLADATRAAMVTEVNVIEEPLKMVWQAGKEHSGVYHPAWISFRPFETKFVLVNLY